MAIDLTDRYYAVAYMQGGTGPWTISRVQYPVRAIPLHHTAGWYGAKLGANATQAQEEQQIESIARDHRERFGIGPAYNYFVFPSGRVYAAGKVGTHRAHTKGRNPNTLNPWNYDGIAVCAVGNYEVEQPTPQLIAGIRTAVDEIRSFGFVYAPDIPVFGHGVIPTVDSQGKSFSQATACPGRFLLPIVGTLNQFVTPEIVAKGHLDRAEQLLDEARGAIAEARSALK